MTRFHASIIVAFVGCAGVLGCGNPLDDDTPDPTGSAIDPIINGTVVSIDTIGTPCLYGCTFPTGICSGTMLTSTWMLTAHHCVAVGGAVTGGTVRTDITAHLKGGPSVAPDWVVLHPTLDVALVKFTNPLLDASNQPMTGNRLWRGNVLRDGANPVYTQGWGANAITSCGPQIGSGEGVLRSGMETVLQGTPGGFVVVPSQPNRQITFLGDSGSAPFQTVEGRRRPIGVLSSGTCQSDPNAVLNVVYSGVEYFRDWANGVIGGAPAAGPSGGFERTDGVTSLVQRTASNRVKEFSLSNGGWRVADLTGLSAAPATNADPGNTLSPYVRGDSFSAVVFRDNANQVREITRIGTGWQTFNLTDAVRNDNLLFPPFAESAVSAYTRSDTISAAVFHSGQHIYEISLQPGAPSWVLNDWTNFSHGAAANPRSNPIGYIRVDGVAAVVFVDNNLHVHEYANTAPNVVVDTDLSSAATGSPAVGPGMSVHPYSRSDLRTAVVYVDQAGDIQELTRVINTSTWVRTNLSTLSSVGAIGRARVAVPFVRSDFVNAVLFQTTADDHIHELELGPSTGNVWKQVDLTVAATRSTGAPPGAATTGGPAGFVRADNVTSVVYNSAARSDLVELTLEPGGWKYVDHTLRVQAAAMAAFTPLTL